MNRKGKKVAERKGQTYSLSASTKTVDQSKSAPEVAMPPELEKKVVDFIQKNLANSFITSSVSKRLTTKKLTDMYETLQRIGFEVKEIEKAMSQRVIHGGDLLDVLDWLCLFTPDEKLPEGFSQAFNKEVTKSREAFNHDAQQDILKHDVALAIGSSAIKATPNTSANNEKPIDMKQWILQYAAYGSDSDASSESNEIDSDEHDNIDVNEEYEIVLAKLGQLRNEAADAKQEKNSQKQKILSENIMQLTKRKAVLEQSSGFNVELLDKQVGRAKRSSEQKPGDNEDLMTDIFSEDAMAPPDRPSASVQQRSYDKRSFEYTRQQWTGKSPKQFLIDWVRKNLPGSPPPSFQNNPLAGSLWKSRCRVVRKKDGDVEVCPDIVTTNVKEAEHLASTLALYQLCTGQKVYQLLPPPYRDVWLEWQTAENNKKKTDKEEITKPRAAFVNDLLQKIKQTNENKTGSDPVAADASDSWEDLDTDTLATNSIGPKSVLPSGYFDKLLAILQRCQTSKVHNELLQTRRELPVFNLRPDLMNAIAKNQVVIIAGETGSGKSTQVPQFLLEEMIASQVTTPWSIVCTQPRRISAITLATRVCDELGSSAPGRDESLCGYQIRFDVQRSAYTQLLYCTTGVLLRQLQQDPELKHVSHVIVDEVHERSVESDFLLIILKELVQKNSHIKVILMSATLDAVKFSTYFNNCPLFQVSGRLHPVELFFLEDVIEMIKYKVDGNQEQSFMETTYRVETSSKFGSQFTDFIQVDEQLAGSDSIRQLDPTKYSKTTRACLNQINPDDINLDIIVELLYYMGTSDTYRDLDGAVLIFLPGMSHIQELNELLMTDSRFTEKNGYRVIAMHSELSPEQQKSAFLTPPCGIRKIVLSTNIAETGVTIPDVTIVIDTGKVKEKRYTEGSAISSLRQVFISQASAEQRQGRAGRVRPGLCFRMYTQNRYQSLQPYSVPEILRVPLEELCLLILKCGYGHPQDFLLQALDPPTLRAITSAVDELKDLGACSADGLELTALGHHLAALPVNVRIGKMLIFSAILGCLQHMSILASAMSDKSMFVIPMAKKDVAAKARRIFEVPGSDHLTLLNAYISWFNMRQSKGTKAEVQFCRENYLRRSTLLEIERVSNQMQYIVESCGFSRHTNHEGKLILTQHNIALLRAVLAAGLFPRVGKIKVEQTAYEARSRSAIIETCQGSAQIHGDSVNVLLNDPVYVVYTQKEVGSKVFVRDNTVVGPFPLLLFGGDINAEHIEKRITIDSWISFKAYAKTAVIMKKLQFFLNELLKKKLHSPQLDLNKHPLIEFLVELLTKCS